MAFSSRPQGEGNSQVYVSFRSIDVRNAFLGYLFYALDRAGIRTNVDIEDSRIAIVLFSKNYASSSRCLDELAKIMECKKQGSLFVIPVFDMVHPRKVREQRGRFGEALAKHEAVVGKDSKRLRRWRESLSEAGDLSGWTLDADGNWVELAKRTVEFAKVNMDRMPMDVNKLRRSYDVFLSFRGPDSRHTIISHLYPALCQKGVCTFKDTEKLEAGQSRSELFEAIKASRIAVIMFSENYARSKWCLDELTNIMERKEMNQLIVVPIFYRVSPREVRLHEKENSKKGCYQAAMKHMEAKYGKDNPVMVESWKKALWTGGDLIGFSIGQGDDEVLLSEELSKGS